MGVSVRGGAHGSAGSGRRCVQVSGSSPLATLVLDPPPPPGPPFPTLPLPFSLVFTPALLQLPCPLSELVSPCFLYADYKTLASELEGNC